MQIVHHSSQPRLGINKIAFGVLTQSSRAIPPSLALQLDSWLMYLLVVLGKHDGRDTKQEKEK
jgi:hypothetical protein